MGETIAVVDFETTGMGPQHGARATEVAVVLVRDGAIVDRFHSLMRSDVPVPPFVEGLTGITNAMLRDAPPAEEVMRDALAFAQGVPMVAHNAPFDRSFWVSEARHAGVTLSPVPAFACTVLLGRRILSDAPSHKLSHLAAWCGIERSGPAHRALSDAEVTAALWLKMQADVAQRFAAELAGRPVGHALMVHVQALSKCHGSIISDTQIRRRGSR
jgi:DNA polymerase III subunit epsilon